MKPLLVNICGAPGAGKSTLARILFDHYLLSGRDVVMLAADDYMMVDGEYRYDRAKLGFCHMSCQMDAEHFLKQNYVVIIHNTSTRKFERVVYERMAQQLQADYQVIVLQGPWQNVHGVPETKVLEMKNRLEI